MRFLQHAQKPLIIILAIAATVLVCGAIYNQTTIHIEELGVRVQSPNRTVWRTIEHDGRYFEDMPSPWYARRDTSARHGVSIEKATCAESNCTLTAIVEHALSQHVRPGEEVKTEGIVDTSRMIAYLVLDEPVEITAPDGCQTEAVVFALRFFMGLGPDVVYVALECDDQQFLVMGFSTRWSRERLVRVVDRYVQSVEVDMP